MTLRLCLDCTTTYAVGVARCPHCGSERGQEHGSDPYRGGTEPMAKITKHGGVSDANAPAAPPEEPEAGEQPSPGSSSETSSPKPEPSTTTSEPARPRRARTTASRSGKARTAGSTARSTAGDQTEPTSETDSDE